MSNLLSRFTCPIVVLSTLLVCSTGAAREQWTPAEANRWYAQQPWLVGSNFNPSTAINQLEMWQADTFDLPTIDRELGWAESLGMNTIRVYLHDLLWQQDSAGFLQRMEQFLEVADRHGIRVMFVHFDSVWNPHPKLGKQPEPTPHVHNSGWVQSPGVKILKDPDRYDSLQAYVQGVIGHFATTHASFAGTYSMSRTIPTTIATVLKNPRIRPSWHLACLKNLTDGHVQPTPASQSLRLLGLVTGPTRFLSGCWSNQISSPSTIRKIWLA
jgi:hypothetical protein